MTTEREYRDQPIPQTSLATREPAPDEVTVRFTRWTAWGQTAYQKHTFAGFPRSEAEKMVAQGCAIIVSGTPTREPIPRAPRMFGG